MRTALIAGGLMDVIDAARADHLCEEQCIAGGVGPLWVHAPHLEDVPSW